MIQKSKKILLGTILGVTLTSVAIATPIVLTSCNSSIPPSTNLGEFYNILNQYTNGIDKTAWTNTNSNTIKDVKDKISNFLTSKGISLTINAVDLQTNGTGKTGIVTITFNESLNDLFIDTPKPDHVTIDYSKNTIQVSDLGFKPDTTNSINITSLFNAINSVALNTNAVDWKSSDALLNNFKTALTNNNITNLTIKSINPSLPSNNNTGNIELIVDDLSKFSGLPTSSTTINGVSISFDTKNNKIIVNNLNLKSENNKVFDGKTLFTKISEIANKYTAEQWNPISSELQTDLDSTITPIITSLGKATFKTSVNNGKGTIEITTSISDSDKLIANPIPEGDNFNISSKTITISNLTLKSPSSEPISFNANTFYTDVNTAVSTIAPDAFTADALNNNPDFIATIKNAFKTATNSQTEKNITIINVDNNNPETKASFEFSIAGITNPNTELKIPDDQINNNITLNESSITINKLTLPANMVDTNNLVKNICFASTAFIQETWEKLSDEVNKLPSDFTQQYPGFVSNREALINGINSGLKTITESSLSNLQMEKITAAKVEPYKNNENTGTLVFNVVHAASNVPPDLFNTYYSNNNQVILTGNQITIKGIPLKGYTTSIDESVLFEKVSKISELLTADQWKNSNLSKDSQIQTIVNELTNYIVVVEKFTYSTNPDNSSATVNLKLYVTIKDNPDIQNVTVEGLTLIISNLPLKK